MHIALWDHPAAALLAHGITVVAPDATVERADPAQCLQWLRERKVDIALVPTLEVLSDADEIDVLPAMAFSSWSFPAARLVLRRGLGQAATTIAVLGADRQTQFVARVVLGEHYNTHPSVSYLASAAELSGSGHDVWLLAGAEVGAVPVDGLVLDLGQEWYELANYPMVWGLLAVRKGEAAPEYIRLVREAVEASEKARTDWLDEAHLPAEVEAFVRDEFRLRYDDLATASLTEFRHYLLYYGYLDEVPEVPVVYLEEAHEEDEEDDRPPLL